MGNPNSCILREEQIWNRVFIPHKNAIRVVVDAVNQRQVIVIDVQPGNIGNELEITIPKEVVFFRMKARGNARMKIAPNQGDIAAGVYYTYGPHGVHSEEHLASDEDVKVFVEIDKQRKIEIFLWLGNFQE